MSLAKWHEWKGETPCLTHFYSKFSKINMTSLGRYGVNRRIKFELNLSKKRQENEGCV